MNQQDCTILLCSCDSYEDTWYPFFKLFSKFWSDCPFEVLLNTESKQYKYNDLNIRCLKKYADRTVPYGERMIAHIKEIHTPYTLILMDDFFIRKLVQESEINKVIEWMNHDPRAVVFSFQAIQDSLNCPSDKYKGYNRRPVYGEYKYNFQAAIWRTDYLLNSWRKHESPWEWETKGNYRSFTSKYDFYVIGDDADTPIDYGFRNGGMGIYRGKWVKDSVVELFKQNEIEIDFSKRGFFESNDRSIVRMAQDENLIEKEIGCIKSYGIIRYTRIITWRLFRKLSSGLSYKTHDNWYEYKREKEKKNGVVH